MMLDRYYRRSLGNLNYFEDKPFVVTDSSSSGSPRPVFYGEQHAKQQHQRRVSLPPQPPNPIPPNHFSTMPRRCDFGGVAPIDRTSIHPAHFYSAWQTDPIATINRADSVFVFRVLTDAWLENFSPFSSLSSHALSQSEYLKNYPTPMVMHSKAMGEYRAASPAMHPTDCSQLRSKDMNLRYSSAEYLENSAKCLTFLAFILCPFFGLASLVYVLKAPHLFSPRDRYNHRRYAILISTLGILFTLLAGSATALVYFYFNSNFV